MLHAVNVIGRPTYQDALRAVGRYFDRNGHHRVLVCEVDDGFMARVYLGQHGIVKVQGITLPISDLLALISSQEQGRGVPLNDIKLSPLFPTGYEDCFRSLGYELDSVGACNVCLAELTHGLMVTYVVVDARGRQPAQLYYDRARIDELLSKGHQRRGAGRHAGQATTPIERFRYGQ